MRKQPYPVIKLTGGVNKAVDATLLADTDSANLRCVRFEDGLIKKDYGWNEIGSNDLPLTGQIMKIDNYEDITGTKYTIIVTTTKVYRYVQSTDSYIELTSSNLTGDVANAVSSLQTGMVSGNEWVDMYVFTNGEDYIQKWTGTGNTANLGGWAANSIKAKSIASFASRLLAGYTIESNVANPWRVRWSIAGDVEDTSGTGSGFADLADTPGEIIGMVKVKGKLYVIKTDSIWEMVYVGGTTYLTPELVMTTPAGASLQGIVLTDQDLLVVYGRESVFVFDGMSLERIDMSVNPLLFRSETSIVNQSRADRVVGRNIDNSALVKFFCPKKDTDSPNIEFSFDLDYAAWSIRERAATAIGRLEVDDNSAWDDMVGPWTIESANANLTFVNANSTVEQDAGNFIADGFSANDIVYTSSNNNPGPFEISANGVAALELTFETAPSNEGPIAGTVEASVPGNWSEDTVPAGAPVSLYGDANGNVYQDDGSYKTNELMSFETKDWIFAHAQRWSEIRIQARGGPFNLGYSLDEGFTWSANKTFEASNVAGEFKEHILYFNKTSQKIRARVTTTANDLEIKWIEPWFIRRGRSKDPVI